MVVAFLQPSPLNSSFILVFRLKVEASDINIVGKARHQKKNANYVYIYTSQIALASWLRTVNQRTDGAALALHWDTSKGKKEKKIFTPLPGFEPGALHDPSHLELMKPDSTSADEWSVLATAPKGVFVIVDRS